jgi:hypothetical protein
MKSEAAGLGVAGGEAGEDGVGFLQNGIGKGWARRTQENEQLAGPQENVEQAAPLEVVEMLAAHRHFEGAARAFLDEGTQKWKFERQAALAAATRINATQIFVTKLDEVVYAEVLLSEGSHWGSLADTHGADAILRHRRHSSQFVAPDSCATRFS